MKYLGIEKNLKDFDDTRYASYGQVVGGMALAAFIVRLPDLVAGGADLSWKFGLSFGFGI